MTEELRPTRPPWEEEDAFPPKPEGHDFGYIRWGRPVPCTRERLIARFAAWKVIYPKLIWAPELRRLSPPVEWSPLVESIRTIRLWRWLLVTILALLLTCFLGYLSWLIQRSGIPWKVASRPLILLELLLFGIIPLAWSYRRYRALFNASPDRLARIGASPRLISWVVTRWPRSLVWIGGVLVAAWGVQFFFGYNAALSAAGGDRRSIVVGEYWRMLTAGMLHFTWGHFLGNLVGLIPLAWILEALTGRRIVLLTFVFSAITSSIPDLLTGSHNMSAGASGAIAGLFGHLLAFSVIRHRDVPGLWKVCLWYFAVNVAIEMTPTSHVNSAGHAGGLLGGMILGGWLHSPWARPRLRAVRVAGTASGVLLVVAAVGILALTAFKYEGLWGLWRRADWAARRSHHEEAIRVYTRMLERDPNHFNAYYGRAHALVSTELYEEARRDYDSCLRLKPDDSEGLIGRAVTLRLLGEFESAKRDLERILAWVPEHAGALAERAHVRFRAGDLESALKDAELACRLTELDVHDFTPYNYAEMADQAETHEYALGVRGRIRVALKDYDGAIRDFSEAMRVTTSDTYRSERGHAWRLKGDFEKALVDFEADLKAWPEDPDALLGRGLVRMAQDDRRARADLEAALKTTQRSWRGRAEAEAALRELGD